MFDGLCKKIDEIVNHKYKVGDVLKVEDSTTDSKMKYECIITDEYKLFYVVKVIPEGNPAGAYTTTISKASIHCGDVRITKR